MRRIGVVGKGQSADLEAILVRLAEWARAHEIELYAEESSLPATVHFPPLTADQDLDLLLALGGDGTLLRTARLRAGQEIPVLGVNMGQLGFLTAAQADDMETALDQVLAGDHHLDVRFTLEARVLHEGGAPDDHFLALNDFAIHKGGVARVTHLVPPVPHAHGEVDVGALGEREQEPGEESAQQGRAQAVVDNDIFQVCGQRRYRFATDRIRCKQDNKYAACGNNGVNVGNR